MKRRPALNLLILALVALAAWQLGRLAEPAHQTPASPALLPANNTPKSAEPQAETAAAAQPAGTETDTMPRRAAPPPGSAATEPSAATTPREAQSLPAAGPDALADLEDVQVTMREYRNVFRENPVGSNAEIMNALNGANSRNVRLGPPAGQHLNESGELCDRWGTPYFFHQLSGIRMEIRSAGPDRKMWTDDDLLR